MLLNIKLYCDHRAVSVGTFHVWLFLCHPHAVCLSVHRQVRPYDLLLGDVITPAAKLFSAAGLFAGFLHCPQFVHIACRKADISLPPPARGHLSVTLSMEAVCVGFRVSQYAPALTVTFYQYSATFYLHRAYSVDCLGVSLYQQSFQEVGYHHHRRRHLHRLVFGAKCLPL